MHTGGGLYVLDIADHFINNYGIVGAGLVEAIVIAWMFKLTFIKDHVNPISDFPVGPWFEYLSEIYYTALLEVLC